MIVELHLEPPTLVWRELGGMLAAAQRVGQPDSLAQIAQGLAQLWSVVNDGRPIAAVVTQIKPDRRCLLWQIAGSRTRDWGAAFIEAVEAWAKSIGCVALYGVGRQGWAPVVEALGFQRIPDAAGRAVWERRIA